MTKAPLLYDDLPILDRHSVQLADLLLQLAKDAKARGDHEALLLLLSPASFSPASLSCFSLLPLSPLSCSTLSPISLALFSLSGLSINFRVFLSFW